MASVRYCNIDANESGQRLDNFLMRILKGVPKSHIYRIIRAGEVRINKKRARPDTRLREDDSVRIPPVNVAAKASTFVGSKISETLQNSVIYEDANLLVINKTNGLAVHGGSGESVGVIEALRQIRKDLPYLELVHRIDKETSGCLLLAKKRSVLRAIQQLFVAKQVRKTYWALLANPWVGKKSLLVDAPLEKNVLKSGERVVHVSKNGKESYTTFSLINNFKQACLVAAHPKTGRTHQIRVHGAYIGHAIIGDKKYGSSSLNLDIGKRLYLHARAIQFTLDGHKYKFEAQLDETFDKALSAMRTPE